jgi:hypothetical protein
LSQKKRQNIILGIIAIVVIGLVIVYYYSAEQTRIKGLTFGNNLQRIQEDLKKIQTDFQSEITVWEDGDISKDEFSEYSDAHISKMEELVSRYDALDPPEVFSSSVELFKLSTQSQLESDKEIIRWIQSGDIDAKIRSDSLMEESFGYEMAALTKFNEVKAGIYP